MRYILITIITFFATISNTQEVLFIECWAGVAKADCEDINKCIDFPEPYELSCEDLNKFSDCINDLVDTPEQINPSSIIPIPDNETDTAIRTGQAGSSVDYARADHNHPIRKQANPGYPVWAWTLSNGSTQSQVVNYGFWSDEEAIYFRHRFLITVNQGVGWNWVTVPSIAGFQRPQITTLTTYHQPEREMSSDAAEWTNIPRIYLDDFNKDADDDGNWYVHVVTKYIRL